MLNRAITHIKTYALLYLGVTIHVLFYISACSNGWFDVFFSGAALHVGAKGIDFYQIPRGAWAFWHGGSLTGEALPGGAQYAHQEFANDNVYHPLFTVGLGSLLMLIPPLQAPYAWLGIKLALSLATLGYFFWTFRTRPYVQFAIFIVLINMSVYLELAAWQFHFVLNLLFLLLLTNLVQRRSQLWGGMLYWLTLLVKPVGLLFAPALVFKGRWRLAVIGISLFVLSTLFFFGAGQYYTQNLWQMLLAPGTAGPNQIITLNALLHYHPWTHWPEPVYKGIQYSCLLLCLLLSSLRRIHISKAIFLSTAYFLLFYTLTFEYQWSSLAYVLAVCIVCCPEFQTRFSLFCILLICLPDTFVLLNLWHIDIINMDNLGLIPGETAWQWMVVSKVVPLLLLCISVLAPDIRPVGKQFIALGKALYRVNDHLQVFGETRGKPWCNDQELAIPQTPPLRPLSTSDSTFL